MIMLTMEEKRARAREKQKRYYLRHPEKLREISRRHHWKHREERLLYNRQYRKDNLEKETERNRIYNEAHKPERRAYGIKWRTENPTKVKMLQQRWQLKLKQETLTHYGNGKCGCIRCGESRLACLSLDHIKGDGAERRKVDGLGGARLYLDLRKRGFPNEGYQTLCMNCQFVKRIEENEYGRPRGTD